jgi:NAD(P)-dependent dehydrogenase (short-subunit alcohol dehydrogenase family)
VSLASRHVVVTGGASGMGLAAAETFAGLGARVTILDVDEERLRAAADRLDAHFAVCDVRSEESVDAAFASAEERLGSVWVLAAAAGVLDGALTLDAAAPEVWRQAIDVNLTGVYLTNRRAALSMRRAGEGGRIVNWSSLASAMGLRGYAAYCASKGGVESLTRVLAVELGAYGITVNAIVLGPVATPMLGFDAGDDRERAELPAGRVAEPAEVAQLAAFVASDAGYLTGACIEFSGGLGAARGSFPLDELPERFARLHGREIDPALLS